MPGLAAVHRYLPRYQDVVSPELALGICSGSALVGTVIGSGEVHGIVSIRRT